VGNQSLFALNVEDATVNLAVVTEAIGIQLPESELADVFLAATSSVIGLTLVTDDTQLFRCLSGDWAGPVPVFQCVPDVSGKTLALLPGRLASNGIEEEFRRSSPPEIK